MAKDTGCSSGGPVPLNVRIVIVTIWIQHVVNILKRKLKL